MPRPARDVKAALSTKFDFVPAPNKSPDHEWFALEIEGAQKVATKFSRGEREVDDWLLGQIAKQLLVRRAYLDEMIDCTKSRDEYYQKLRENPEGPHVRRP
jgi:hypothetical protein